MSKYLTGLGIMSGSSLDGLDFAIVKFKVGEHEILETKSLDFDDELKATLPGAIDLNLKDYLLLEQQYSEFVATGVNNQLENAFDFIAVHGHTTVHLPKRKITHQLVNGGILSAHTRKPVVTDFRIGDLALGGVGTPLVPKLEKDLFEGYDYYLNLGGIANLSISKDWTAFDVSPCNQLSNFVAGLMDLEYDAGGRVAAQGQMNQTLFDALSDFEYYQLPAPKSIDNNWIRDHYFPLLANEQISNADKLYTINAWIAQTLSPLIEKDKSVFTSGGGAFNDHLIASIRGQGIDLYIPENEIIDYKEAILMAYLGYLRINRQSNIMSSVTGASEDSIGGAIYNIHGTEIG